MVNRVALPVGLIELESRRLRLRQWRAADRAPFAALNADPAVMAHFPAPLTRQASDAMLARCAELIVMRGWGFWALERKADGAFIGLAGLHVPDARLPCAPCVEIGWRLAAAYWGQGYATEAAGAALAVAFDRLGLDEVVSFTTLTNTRSQAVMQRLGMRPAGCFAHPALAEDSPLRTLCLYRLSRTRWQDTHNQKE
ncbi:MAG: N-acetyltransferase [Proteobacteria bacterium]|nr:MAG: N-acetyltransferase [Pseudomonadota bacterium]